MTDFNELFNKAKYGSYNSSYELRLTTNIYDPAGIMEADRLAQYDKWTEEAIERVEEGLQILKDYRAAIAQRYSEIETAATIPVIRLRRQRDFWKEHKVFYHLEEITRYVDTPNPKAGKSYTDRVDRCTTYAGSDRRQALKDFEAYKKTHPGITAELDIEKSKWER